MEKQKNRHRLKEYAGTASYQHEAKSEKEYRFVRRENSLREFRDSSSKKA